ncbi:MAG: Gfo/Idh/MocA family oxidoreductase [Acidobacteria bacterium]|nr:Gfo/Idh/MocA family oxidoreductase [Acidobacteriota bacterium]
MKRVLALVCFLALPLCAQQYKIAIVSGLHAHVWGPLKLALKGDKVKFVGFAETLPELVAQAGKTGVPDKLIFSDYKKMIDETKPDMVWAFTETYRHLEVVQFCAPRGIHVIVEKPLAATYKQALEIQKLARKHNIHVLTNYGSTWQASNYAVKAAVDAGAIGPVYRLRAVVGHGGPGDPKKSSFVAWLADPVKNGGGALVDFGCYSMLWSVWMKGMPESVYTSVLHLKPEMYPLVEDNATIILNYKDGVAIFEGSWDLPPRPPSGNEIFGRNGSIVMGRPVELRKTGARGQQQTEQIKVQPLPPERSDAIAYLVNRLTTKQPLEGMTTIDINVQVQEVLEAAKMSVKSGRAVRLPLKK